MPGENRSVDISAPKSKKSNDEADRGNKLTERATYVLDKYYKLAERVSKLFNKEMKEGQVSLNEKLEEQGGLLLQVNKKWKEMTGAIIGSFYTIAKLSPMFASYISEFGGILGYVYDTALMPWNDEIERALDLLWAFGDWFDQAPESVKKFTGAVLLGIPILTGFAIALAIAVNTMKTLGQVIAIQKILQMASAFGLANIAAIALGVAIFAVAAYFILTSKAVKEKMEEIQNNIERTTENIKRIFSVLGRIVYGILVDTIGKEATDKMIGFFSSAKDAIVGFFGDIKRSLLDLYNWVIEHMSIFSLVASLTGGTATTTGWAADKLEAFADRRGYATGATITQDGLYRLHQGETVIPASISNNKENVSTIITISPNITIQGGVGSYSTMSEAKKLADLLSKYWKEDIRSVMGGSHR